MALLNFTTQISVEKTTAEMQKMLTQAGAKRIMTEFNNAGEMVALSFQIMTDQGEQSFQLPANVSDCLEVLKKQKNAGKCALPWTKINHAQAARVAWRILKDWLEVQLALIETRQAKVEQIFLPYMLVAPGVTMYDAYQNNQLALPASNRD